MAIPTNNRAKPRMITLTLGDPSNDGHGQTEVLYISTLATNEELQEAYKTSSTLFGFRMGQVCEEYECSELTEEQALAFTAHGFPGNPQDPDFGVDWGKFLQLFLFFMNKSLSEKNRMVEVDPPAELGGILSDGFGYGLFGS